MARRDHDTSKELAGKVLREVVFPNNDGGADDKFDHSTSPFTFQTFLPNRGSD